MTVGVPGASQGRHDDSPSHSVAGIAIYPDIAGLAARSLRPARPSYRTAV